MRGLRNTMFAEKGFCRKAFCCQRYPAKGGDTCRQVEVLFAGLNITKIYRRTNVYDLFNVSLEPGTGTRATTGEVRSHQHQFLNVKGSAL